MMIRNEGQIKCIIWRKKLTNLPGFQNLEGLSLAVEEQILLILIFMNCVN